MRTDSERLELLLNSIEENCSPSEYESAALPFMFDCISQVIDQLPPEARESLRIALSFAQGELGQASLLGAVEISWKSLGKGPESLQFDDPRVAGIRAVICLLHMQLYCENKQSHPECSDFTDLMSFYLRLLNNVATRLELQEALIKKWFSRCL